MAQHLSGDTRMNQRDVLDYDIGARIVVEFTTDRREIVDYAVIRTVDDDGRDATVRVYDGCGPRSLRFAPTTRR